MVKYCHKCGAQLKDESSKFCTSCGSKVLELPQAETPIQNKPIPAQTQTNYQTNWSLILLFIFGLICIFIPLLLIIIVIISAIAVYYDAKAIGVGTQSTDEATMKSNSWSPTSWALLVLLLWILMLPFYLIKRREISRR